jgi:hypothetical protein
VGQHRGCRTADKHEPEIHAKRGQEN